MGDEVQPSADGHLSWAALLLEGAVRIGEALGGDRAQEARWIVERVSGYDANELRLNETELVSARSVSFFDALVARRCGGEPLQYVLGRWQFRYLELVVDRNVLIPRPETEVVAGIAIDAAKSLVAERKRLGLESAVRVLDLGTGSGAIALSVTTEVPQSLVWATDASAAALSVARANLAGLGRAATRVTMLEGNWFGALHDDLRASFSVIVSNPPYVAEFERVDLAADVLDWEPQSALFADDDGRSDVAVILEEAHHWLEPGGTLVVEMAPHQTAWAAELATAKKYVDVAIIQDLAGRDRALIAKLAG
jgi:release factor glutamine methyltransferase